MVHLWFILNVITNVKTKPTHLMWTHTSMKTALWARTSQEMKQFCLIRLFHFPRNKNEEKTQLVLQNDCMFSVYLHVRLHSTCLMFVCSCGIWSFLRSLVTALHGILLITSLITGQRLYTNNLCVWMHGFYLSHVYVDFTLAIYIFVLLYVCLFC